MAKKEGKKKKGSMGIIAIILVPILVIVLLASFFYSIINGIVNIIKELIGEFARTISDLLKNPIGFVGAKWAQFTNFLNQKGFVDGEFNPSNYEFKDSNGKEDDMRATLVISNDTFKTMKESLNEVINRDAALLDDIMLKKMLLTYYRGIYLNDTNVLIELTAENLNMSNTEWDKLWEDKTWTTEEWKKFIGSFFLGGAFVATDVAIENFKETTWFLADGQLESLNEKYDFYPYEIIAGDSINGVGEDKHLYLKTTGMVEIYAACNKCNGLENDGNSTDTIDCEECKKQKIIYFTPETLKLMYEKEYLAMLPNCNDDCKAGIKNCYAHSALEYLKKAYTYRVIDTTVNDEETDEENIQSDNIIMYSKRIQEDEGANIEYLNETKQTSEAATGWERIKSWFGAKEQNSMIRPYTSKNVSPNEAQTINYGEKVIEYATPMELMVNLLNITSSKDFVNSFIETVGNENYIKLKLYTLRDRDISCIVEEWNRETEIEAIKESEFRAEVVARNKIGFDWTGDTSEGIEGVFANVVVDYINNTYRVTLSGADPDYHYKVNVYQDNVLIKEGFLVNWQGWKYESNIVDGNASVTEDYSIDIPKNKLVTFNWKDNSDIRKIVGKTKVTDQYYPAISEAKTWYGIYKGINSINREYYIDQLVGDEELSGAWLGAYYFLKENGQDIEKMKNEEVQALIDAFISMEESLANTVATNGTSEIKPERIGETTTGIRELNYRYNESYTVNDFYEKLLEMEDLTLLPIWYPSVEDYDEEWKTNQSFDSSNQDVIRVNDYNDMVNTENYWGEISWMPVGDYFTEEEIRNIQLNYIMQNTKEKNSGELRDYSYLSNNNYKVTEMKQTDDMLLVTNISMHYSESVTEGLDDGNKIPNDDRIQKFLGLLSNNKGEYEKGATFLPESSGGKLVQYKDISHKVATRLVDNEGMLYELFQESTRTQRFIKVMKVIMYIYKNNHYIVNNWQYDVYENGMVNVGT